MENKAYEDNLVQVNRYDPQLAQSIKDTKITSQLELSKTQKDEYNLIYKGQELHSAAGAEDEAKNIVSNISNIDKKNSICIIFGIGLSYLFDEAVKRAQGKVILYEPSLEILKTTFEVVELKALLSKESAFVCADLNTLKAHIKSLSDKETDISISFLNSYKNLFGAQLNELAQVVQYSHGEEQAVENTIKAMGKDAVVNTFSNIAFLKQTRFIKELEGKFKGKPALIVSAGPSLAKNIDFIKENQDKMVIFCVGTARRLLAKHGIVPDFLCVVEPKSTQGQYEGLDLSKDNIIVEPVVHPAIMEAATKNKFLHPSKGNFLNDWLCKALKISNNGLLSMGTVSYTALSCAKLMGCEPIILIGQDLAYSDGRCYAQGSAYSELVCELEAQTGEYRIFPKDKEKYKQELMGKSSDMPPENTEEAVEKYLKFLNDNLMTVKGQDGELLPTQSAYALFIKHFETFASKHPACELINASTGGAQIEGYKNIPLNDIKLRETFDKDLENLNLSKTKYDLKSLERAYQAVAQIIRGAVSELEKMKLLNDKIAKEFRPKNVQKLKESLRTRLKSFNDDYFTKHLTLYYLLFWSFTTFYNSPLQKPQDANYYIRINRQYLNGILCLYWDLRAAKAFEY